ncbi:MAG: sigma-70 family RNA polymerase sigma factor [Planctomycetes bacterium]|nr:sigma-70 family RNA polymerase sigma factor [Planctomycetota bacterium]
MPQAVAAMNGPTSDFLLKLTSHQSMLYAAIAALLGGVDGAHDILQETNVVLLEKAGEYDSSRPFAAWALTFARFQVLAWRKRQSRDRLVLNDHLFAVLADRLTKEAVAPSKRLDAIEKCLAKLAPDSRKLIDLRYVDGKSVQAIAVQSGRSENVISVTLFRIRKTLLDCVASTLATEGGR